MPVCSRLNAAIEHLLRCPRCRAHLEPCDNGYRCVAPACRAVFPVIGGVPVLIDEEKSVFTLDEIAENYRGYRRGPAARSRGKAARARDRLRTAARFQPDVNLNFRGKANYARFARLLLDRAATPRVLILGGRILGHGADVLLDYPAIQLVESDVAFGPRTALICDAHDIPFADGSFDGIAIQAVLEHVADPYRCVAEIHRVLQPAGLVYAETPFMQQVHGGPYDFTRFTPLGHRRLFRHFEEVDSGAIGGPGMALAWAYLYYLLSFGRTKRARALLSRIGRFTGFLWKYSDYFLIDRPAALDAASGSYFLGRRSDTCLPDRELIALYRGAH